MGATIGPDSDFNLVMMALTAAVVAFGKDVDKGTVTKELVLPKRLLHEADPTGTLGVRFDAELNGFVLEMRKGPKGRRMDESVKTIMGG